MSSQLRREESESESESDSEEEETKKVAATEPDPPKKQESDEEESDTDSDTKATGSRFNTVKRENNSKVATKAVVADSVPAGKRGRDVNGAKGAPTEEPLSKKRKDAKETKAEKQLASPAKKGGKPELQPMRGSKAATAAKSEKDKVVPTVGKVENAKPLPAAGRKRKASTPPPPPASAKQAQKAVLDKSSPMKPKKTASWSTASEESLVNQLQKDHKNGLVFPISSKDPYWEKLLKRLSLEDLTEVQLCEKVRRMKQRYNVLKDRPKGEGEKVFKSPHEEKIYQVWAEMWGQPATTDEDSSEDESAGTATTAAEGLTKGAASTGKGIDSSGSEEDDEEEEAENIKRKTAGLNQINVASAATPFISKPKLSFTPLMTKEDKRKVDKKVEEVISGDEHTGDVLAGDVGKKGDVVSLANEHLKQLRDETLAFFQELRRNCFQAMEEQRNGSLTGGLGNISFAGKGSGFPRILEGFVGASGSQQAIELQKKWREHKIQELALLSQRLQLLQEQCQLQQEELRLENERLDQ